MALDADCYNRGGRTKYTQEKIKKKRKKKIYIYIKEE